MASDRGRQFENFLTLTTGLMASDRGRQFESLLTLVKEAAIGIAANYQKFLQILQETGKIFSEIYESLRKMLEKFKGEYIGCCNNLIAVFKEGIQYFKEVTETLDASQTQLNMLNEQLSGPRPNYSGMKNLVSQLNKCIIRIQKFQREFSERCEGAIAGANETAIECEGLAARAQMAKRKTQAVGFGVSMVGGVLLGVFTAGIATAIVGATVGTVTVAGGGIITHTWANDYEEVKKEFIEMKKKLRVLQQSSYELQENVGDSKRIAEKLKPMTDTIDRLSTGGGRTRSNRKELQIASQSLAENIKQIKEQVHNSPPQENPEVAVKELKRKASIELEGCTAGKKTKQS